MKTGGRPFHAARGASLLDRGVPEMCRAMFSRRFSSGVRFSSHIAWPVCLLCPAGAKRIEIVDVVWSVQGTREE